MDFLRLAFGFLMFHRRIIIGILLLIGLYFFITKVVPELSKSNRAANDRSKNSPSATTDAADQRPNSTENVTEEPSVDGGNSSDPDVLIQELMRLKDLSRISGSDARSLVLSADIIKIAKQILELPIDLNQRKYVLGALAEASLVMRLVNISSKIADESIDAEFLAKTKELLKDRDPTISSYAAVTLVTSAAFEFHTQPTEEKLAQIETVINEHFENIRAMPESFNKISQLLVKAGMPSNTVVDTQPFFDRLIQKFVEDEKPEIQEVGRSLKESLIFHKLDLENLPFRIGDGKPESDLMVDRFFETLEKFPDASVPIYQVSVDVIREYIIQERYDRALELAEMLKSRVLSQRADDDQKKRILEVIDGFVAIAEKGKSESD